METSTMETITSSLAEPPHSPGRVTGFFFGLTDGFLDQILSPGGGDKTHLSDQGKYFFTFVLISIGFQSADPPPPQGL